MDDGLVVTYRPVFSTGFGLSGPPNDSGERDILKEAEPSDITIMATIISNFHSKLECDDALVLLEEGARLGTISFLELAHKGLSHDDPEVRIGTLDTLGSFSHDLEIPSLLIQGLQDPDAEVRLAALQSAAGLSPSALKPVLSVALQNENLNVRQNALDICVYLGSRDFEDALLDAALSPFPDLSGRALDEAIGVVTKRTINSYFLMIESPDMKIRESVNDLFELRLNANFHSKTHAESWWSENQNRFDEDLVEIETRCH